MEVMDTNHPNQPKRKRDATNDDEDSQEISTLLILNVEELKNSPSEFKKQLELHLTGIKIKKAKFTMNNNLLLYPETIED